MNNCKKKNVMISIDKDLYDFVKSENICLSKEVQMLLKYQLENQLKKIKKNNVDN
jgi:hypothetical protein